MMREEIIFEDRLAPTLSLSVEQRARLRSRRPSVTAALWRYVCELLGLDEHGIWCAETGRDGKGWLPAEYARFCLWKATGGSANDARVAWTDMTRRDFVRHLIAGGRLGVGDEVVSRV